LLSDDNSEWMLGSLFKYAEAVDLPYLGFPTQMDYINLKTNMPQVLSADHAPFWRAGIPCIFVTDMGEYRSPYAHNMGDTINVLDFEFLQKVTQMVLGTLLK
ncbi:MAG: M28 family peptidase, partial [Promethearchaeota archaeon]